MKGVLRTVSAITAATSLLFQERTRGSARIEANTGCRTRKGSGQDLAAAHARCRAGADQCLGEEWQFIKLRFDCGDDARIAETDLVHVVAVEIHIAAALQIFEVNALTTFQDVQAWSGQRLTQEIPGVLVQQGSGLGIDL